jgi:DNA-directed RNA polymerase specialized sigma24 family protein
LRQGLELGIEKSVNEWADTFDCQRSAIHTALTNLRKEQLRVHPVKTVDKVGNTRSIVVLLDLKPTSKKESAIFEARIDGVAQRYDKETNAKVEKFLTVVEAGDSYMNIRLPLRQRIIGLAHKLIAFDYAEFAKLLDSYRDADKQLEARPSSATGGRKELRDR